MIAVPHATAIRNASTAALRDVESWSLNLSFNVSIRFGGVSADRKSEIFFSAIESDTTALVW